MKRFILVFVASLALASVVFAHGQAVQVQKKVVIVNQNHGHAVQGNYGYAVQGSHSYNQTFAVQTPFVTTIQLPPVQGYATFGHGYAVQGNGYGHQFQQVQTKVIVQKPVVVQQPVVVQKEVKVIQQSHGHVVQGHGTVTQFQQKTVQQSGGNGFFGRLLGRNNNVTKTTTETTIRSR